MNEMVCEAEEKRGRGRPPKVTGRCVERYNLWLTEDDVDILDELCYEDDMNRADILRKALRTYSSVRKNKLNF